MLGMRTHESNPYWDRVEKMDRIMDDDDDEKESEWGNGGGLRYS